MSKFPRETIVLVGAIVGANLIGIVTQPKPVRSIAISPSSPSCRSRPNL